MNTLKIMLLRFEQAIIDFKFKNFWMAPEEQFFLDDQYMQNQKKILELSSKDSSK